MIYLDANIDKRVEYAKFWSKNHFCEIKSILGFNVTKDVWDVLFTCIH